MGVIHRLGQGRVGDPDQLEQQKRRIFYRGIKAGRDGRSPLMIGDTREMLV